MTPTPLTDEFRHDCWEASLFAVHGLPKEDADNLEKQIEGIFDFAASLERKIAEFIPDPNKE